VTTDWNTEPIVLPTVDPTFTTEWKTLRTRAESQNTSETNRSIDFLGERYNAAKVKLLTELNLRVFGLIDGRSTSLDWIESPALASYNEHDAAGSDQSLEPWKDNAAYLAAIEAATSDLFDAQFKD